MIKKVFDKISLLFRRRRNAKKLGIEFSRASAWKMPSKILLNNKTIEMNLVEPLSGEMAFIDTLLDDTYGLAYFNSCLKNVKHIIDVGANQGMFMLAARNVFPDAQIHSYEPNAELILSLEHQSKIAQSTFFVEAVGQVEGLVHLDNEPGNSLITKTVLDDSGTIKQVSIKKCIDRIGGNVDLLKLDCEGAEWEILKEPGALTNVKAITLEYHLDDTHNHKSILQVLKDANFKIVHYAIAGPTWGMAWAINNLF